MLMESTRSIFPWILHIDSHIIRTLDLNALNTKQEVSTRNFYHALWSG